MITIMPPLVSLLSFRVRSRVSCILSSLTAPSDFGQTRPQLLPCGFSPRYARMSSTCSRVHVRFYVEESFAATLAAPDKAAAH
jgi:hypothetical protein